MAPLGLKYVRTVRCTFQVENPESEEVETAGETELFAGVQE